MKLSQLAESRDVPLIINLAWKLLKKKAPFYYGVWKDEYWLLKDITFGNSFLIVDVVNLTGKTEHFEVPWLEDELTISSVMYKGEKVFILHRLDSDPTDEDFFNGTKTFERQ